MRWVFGCIVLLNLILWFFNSYMATDLPVRSSSSEPTHHFKTTVTLLSEFPGSDESHSVISQNSETNQEPIKQTCWSVGPFKEIVSVKQVLGRLEALDLHYVAEQREVKAASDYWVYVAVQANRKMAIKTLKELQIKKIDSFLITEGELKNGISLGLFSDKKRADELLLLRKKQGYEVFVKEVPRVYNETWLISTLDEDNEISEEFWAVLKKEYKTLEKRKFFCNSVASAENLD